MIRRLMGHTPFFRLGVELHFKSEDYRKKRRGEKMEKNKIKPFIRNDVKLVFSDGHVREGKITEIMDNHLFFQLSDSVISINLNYIESIVLRVGGL